MSRLWARVAAIIELATTQLRYYPGRTIPAVVGVGGAVFFIVVLGGLGFGMLTTGERAIAWFQSDLWVTGGALAIEPSGVGGLANPIDDAHERSAELETIDGVQYAQPVAFQTVYVSPDGEQFDTIVGVGIGGNTGRLGVASRFNRRDVHYANGAYDGPMTNRIIVGPALADRYDLAEGDTLHVGGTLVSAREHEFTVVGIAADFSNFLGTPTVGMHLSELQEVSGTTGTDSAALIAVTLAPGADADGVSRTIEDEHPSFDVRTDAEQVRATIGAQAPILATAVTFMFVAVVGGIVLIGNVLAIHVHHHRRELAALKATGVGTRTLLGVVGSQGAVLGLAGAVLGSVVALPVTVLLNVWVEAYTGFSGLVATPAWLLVGGLTLGIAMGVLGATVAGWRVARLSPHAHLD